MSVEREKIITRSLLSGIRSSPVSRGKNDTRTFLNYIAIEQHHIIVVTNYPLKTVLRCPELTGCLAKWSIYLNEFDIEFKPKTAIKSQALADFVAEFSPGSEPTTSDEVHNVMIQDNKPWLLYVDRSSNIRGSGLGVVLKSSQGGNMVYSIRCEFKTTNNEAEYEALVAGLDIAHKLGAKHLHVRSDSLLVVNQVNGDFQAKDSKMMSYLKVVKERVARFEHFSIEQIPRDLNMQADALANLGFAFNDPSVENIPILHLTTPTIEMAEEVQMNEKSTIGRSTYGIISSTSNFLKIRWKLEKQDLKLHGIRSLKINSIEDPRLDFSYDASRVKLK
ncbi:hypothetical protein OSB04_024051 [Centaurea solstitialis]|uniref:RNase H type-1 domain-containing protein n=1 Tax=Centaurea solstitialis TaxID=347529 RepID=A0AA38SM23_9ASTR|nr:hypothetical protein OSB04_024051 [Centaurea solstitialis]